MDFVILDTEYTTWEGALQRMWTGPKEERELVQISAIKVNNFETLHCTQFFSVYTKPQINPILSDYFINLTGIKQEAISRNGLSIKKGIEKFVDFSKDSFCLCWGDDINVLKKNIELINSNIELQFYKSADIRKLYNDFGINTSNYNSGTINNFKDMESILNPGSLHNALSDCVSILSSLTKLEKIHGQKKLEKVLNNLPDFQ